MRHTAQTYAHSLTDSSTRLRKAMEAVLAIQERADSLNEAIHDAEANVPRSSRTTAAAAKRTIRQLKVAQGELLHQAQELHATLNVPEEFEEIRGLGLQFTAVLLQAFEAKRTCRTLITNRFQEWAYLDTAAAGKGNAVGSSISRCCGCYLRPLQGRTCTSARSTR